MNYRYHSLPRFEGSALSDRASRNAQNMSHDLMDNYQDTKSKSEKADSVVLNTFSTALFSSPAHVSSKEHVPVHHFVARRKPKHNPSVVDDMPLPTSNLKAHIPAKHDFKFDSSNANIIRNRSLSDVDISNDYLYSKSAPRSSVQGWQPKQSYTRYNSHPRNRELLRIPESSSYYTYRVLPQYNYNANDMIRERRRRLQSKNMQHYDFPEPPIGTFSNMRQSLNGVLDKIDRHKLLLDRYAGVDLSSNLSDVGANITEKSKKTTSYRNRY